MKTTTLVSVVEQDVARLADRACDRIRTSVPHTGDDLAAQHLGPAVRTNLDAFVRAWAEQRPFTEEELAAMTTWCELLDHGLPREVLLNAHRVAIDAVRDHVEQQIKAHGRRLTEPSETMTLLNQLGVARLLERQLIAAVEAATTIRDRAQAADRQGLESDLVAALVDMPTNLTTGHSVIRQLGLTVAGPWTVAAIPAERRASRVRSTLCANDLVGTAVADRPEGVVVLANDTPAALSTALTGEQAAGIGGRVDALPDVRRSAEDAVSALEISVARENGPVRADHAALDLLLVGAVTPADLVDRTLSSLADVDESRRAWLLETIEAYLDAGTSITAAARTLFLHRESMRYRVTQLRQLLGSELDDPDRRLALHLAVKALRHGLCPANPDSILPTAG